MDFGAIAGVAAGPAILGGALGLGGSYMQAQAQAQANQQNIDMSREQMEFQERMSSTAHQREVKDLIKAGLNPILSANAGASSPAGSMATSEPTIKDNIMERAVSHALEIATIKGNLEKQKSEKTLLDSQNRKVNTENEVLKKDIPKAEITNELYDLARRKIKEASQTNIWKTLNDKNEYGKSLHEEQEYQNQLQQKRFQLKKGFHSK